MGLDFDSDHKFRYSTYGLKSSNEKENEDAAVNRRLKTADINKIYYI